MQIIINMANSIQFLVDKQGGDRKFNSHVEISEAIVLLETFTIFILCTHYSLLQK